jgi:hypothetical protein
MIGDIPGSTGIGAANPNQARIAHVGVWDGVLSDANIDAFMAGDNPSTIDAANLCAYFPLTTDAAKSHGSDSVTDLTVTGAVLDAADNPTVDSLLTKYLKLLSYSSAASATGVEGVVLNSTRDTVIGEFTGQAFEASLEGSPGEAVLLIPVADISPNGGTLTTSDAPIVFAYNSTDGTVGEGIASVIEV